jgi:hypothetical protein
MKTSLLLCAAFCVSLPGLALPGVTAEKDAAVQLQIGKDLAGWQKPTGDWTVVKNISLDATDPGKFKTSAGEGAAVNGDKGNTGHLISKEEFGDVELHIEFCLAKRSNSGVYLMGRYEVQIYDSYGVEKDQYPGIECGGIYPRWIAERNVEGHSPRLNASKPAGEWQTFDIVFRAPRFDASGNKTANARFVRVRHNGKTIHENVEVKGPTRAALFEDEKTAGPLMLQGDHGPIAFRNITIQSPRARVEGAREDGPKS